MLVILTATLQGAPTVSADVMRYGVAAAIAEAFCVEMARTERTKGPPLLKPSVLR